MINFQKNPINVKNSLRNFSVTCCIASNGDDNFRNLIKRAREERALWKSGKSNLFAQWNISGFLLAEKMENSIHGTFASKRSHWGFSPTEASDIFYKFSGQETPQFECFAIEWNDPTRFRSSASAKKKHFAVSLTITSVDNKFSFIPSHFPSFFKHNKIFPFLSISCVCNKCRDYDSSSFFRDVDGSFYRNHKTRFCLQMKKRSFRWVRLLCRKFQASVSSGIVSSLRQP